MNNERTWVEVSLSALTHNLEIIRDFAPDRAVMAVVKADAYGHGAQQVAAQLDGKADFFAVATHREALSLRNGGITTPILVLGYVPVEETAALVNNNVRIAIFDPEQAVRLSEEAVRSGVTVLAHFKLDTGMNRLGFADTDSLIAAMKLPNLKAEGFFTHLSVSDEPENPFTAKQCGIFENALERIRAEGFDVRYAHVSNSGGILRGNEISGNLVRAGLLLYGYTPAQTKSDLEPAMRWCATVAQVKTLKKGEAVSYSRRFIADKDMSIAVLSCGYADGYHRVLSNKGEVLIHGKRAKVLGSVCMDMFMVDVTDITAARTGDTAVLLGKDGDDRITPDELAEKANTISYELLCSVSARVPRFYI